MAENLSATAGPTGFLRGGFIQTLVEDSSLMNSIQNKLFIGGKFVDALDGATIEVFNPHDNSLITRVAEAKAADVDLAVAAAERAFPAFWRKNEGRHDFCPMFTDAYFTAMLKAFMVSE